MENRKEIVTEARTPEEAIEIALRELDADRAEVEIDVESRGKPGLLGFGSEPARVRVTLLEQASDVVTAATEILNGLISKMGVDVIVNLTEAHSEEMGGPVFDIDGDDSGLLIGRRGETLRSMQFLVNFMVSRRLGERTRVMLDVAGYQQRRITSLKTMARKVAGRVSSTGRSMALEPMPPNERRIVHLALADRSDVETESTGEGQGRKVVIFPRSD